MPAVMLAFYVTGFWISIELLLRRTLVRSDTLFINKETTETQGHRVAQCFSLSLCLCGSKKLNAVPNVQVCDATKADSSTSARYKKKRPNRIDW